jgi:hypothetical protein
MIRLSLSAMLVAIPTFLFAGVGPKSASYDLDYASVASAGSLVQAGSYNIMTKVTLKGLSVPLATSGSYTVEPLIGAPAPTARISDWALY